jgi:hypothetical protein
MNKNIQLQPLRIPAGWAVLHHDLTKISLEEIDDANCYTYLKEDLLLLTHPVFNRTIALGCYPAGNKAAGAYQLDVYEGDCAGDKIVTFRTRDRHRLVHEIETMFLKLSTGSI